MSTHARDAYNHVARIYDAAFQDNKSQAEDAHIFDRLKQDGYDTGSVLDIGSGTGLFVDATRIPPDRYFGVDISEEMRLVARQKHPHHPFAVGDMTNLEALVPDGVIDNVVCLFGSFSYCMDPLEVVSEIHRVLKPGGRFFVMAYGRRYLTRKTCLLHRAGIPIPRMTYRVDELQRIFSKHFAGVQVSGMSGLVDWLPEGTTVQNFKRLHTVEDATIGKLCPNLCQFLLVEGRKT